MTSPQLLPGLGEEDVPGFPADTCPQELPPLTRHHSAMADTLRAEPRLYHQLRRRETPLGVGLARCIKVGMDNRGHKMVKGLGMVAGDEECFEVFRDLFDPVIQQHNHYPVSGVGEWHCTDLGRFGSRLESTVVDPTGKYAVTTFVRASRNLSGYRFPPAMTREDRHEVEHLLTQALSAVTTGKYFPLRGSQSCSQCPGGMSDRDEAALQDAGCLFEAPDSTYRLCTGASRHWPDGRGVYTASSDPSLEVWVNEQEHLRVTSKLRGDSIQAAFRNVVKTLDAVANELDRRGFVSSKAFAHSARLGFLTSSPANLGTAMQLSVTLRLPRLALLGSRWSELCSSRRVQVRAGGQEEQSTGMRHLADVFELSNSDRLGTSEVEALNLLVRVAAALVRTEMQIEGGVASEAAMATLERELDALAAAPSVPAHPRAVRAAALQQQAHASLRFGLQALDGLSPALQLLSRAGPGVTTPAPALASLPELLQSCQRLAAEHFVTGVLQFAVEGHAASDSSKPVSVAMTEEVLSTACLEDSRPETRDSAVTVQATSETSLNGVAAQELVDELVDLEVEGVGEALEPVADHQSEVDASVLDRHQVLQAKQKLSNLLESACLSGQLGHALGSSSNSAAPPNRSRVPPQQATPQARVREGLLRAFRGGQLEECLQNAQSGCSPQPPGPTGAAEELQAIKRAMAGVLERALESGELKALVAESSLAHERQEEGLALQRMRMQTIKALFSASQRGELVPLLLSIRKSSQSQGQKAISDVELPARLGGQEQKSSILAALRLLSAHDQRLGELAATIQITQRRLAQQAQTCAGLERQLAAARGEVSHLELDIEWHRHALAAADERNAELSLSHRRLLATLGPPRCLGLEEEPTLAAGPGLPSEASVSTATGFTELPSLGMSSSWSCVGRLGHTAMEPLAPWS